jgi:hypothetical protein
MYCDVVLREASSASSYKNISVLSWINIYFVVVNIYEILLTHVGGMLK